MFSFTLDKEFILKLKNLFQPKITKIQNGLSVGNISYKWPSHRTKNVFALLNEFVPDDLSARAFAQIFRKGFGFLIKRRSDGRYIIATPIAWQKIKYFDEKLTGDKIALFWDSEELTMIDKKLLDNIKIESSDSVGKSAESED